MQGHFFAPRREAGEPSPAPIRERALNWGLRVWRPMGTAVVVVLALMLGWHVVNGKHVFVVVQ